MEWRERKKDRERGYEDSLLLDKSLNHLPYSLRITAKLVDLGYSEELRFLEETSSRRLGKFCKLSARPEVEYAFSPWTAKGEIHVLLHELTTDDL